MSSASLKLVDLVDETDPFAFSAEELLPLQLAAAQESFDRLRGPIGLLQQRASDAEIKSISKVDDLIPLLFTHTAYKSYPQSYIRDRRWDKLLMWYNALASTDVLATDISGVEGIDDFVDGLWSAGHFVCTTSGTSGKPSFLNNSDVDRERVKRIISRITGWPDPISADRKRRFYSIGPSRGYYRQVYTARIRMELFSEPGQDRFLSDEPLLVSHVARMGEMRRKMIDGTAKPDEVAAFEREALDRGRRMDVSLQEMARDIIEHRHEPLFVSGQWAQHWAIMQVARQMGVGDGEFHQDSLVLLGGGLKGLRLPSDYREQLVAFYGPVRRELSYGMTEMDPQFMPCEVGRYHIPPWTLPILLDQLGERLVRPDSGEVVDGRFAFVGLCIDGRWGGLITGDHVHMDYSPKCQCGRPGPVILDNIGRFSDENAGDDKIGCAGTMDAYLRGIISE